MALKLLDYQRTSVEFAKKTPYCILALEMGLGKSCVALYTAVELGARALIVCPPYLALNWLAEINKFFPGKNVSLLRHKKEFYYPVDSDFVIITYSFLPDADILFEWANMVIIDECHFLKTHNTKRTEAAHRLIYENSISRVLMLTGTPILNRVYELHSLLCIIQYDPRVEGSKFLEKFPNFVSFANHFSNLEEFEIWRGGRKVKVQNWSGTRNLDGLKELLSKYMIRFRSIDVLDLPQYQEHFIRVDNQDWPELLSAFSKFRDNDDNDSVLPQIKAMAALEKAPMTSEFAKGLLESGLQIIVYSDHVEAAQKIAKDLKVEVITGSTPMNVRNRIATLFQTGETQVIVATIGAFSTGINLQCAFNMIFNDLPWIPGALEQAKFRIIRVGQKHRCQFYYMMGSFQDEYIFDKLQDKKETIKRVLE